MTDNKTLTDEEGNEYTLLSKENAAAKLRELWREAWSAEDE